MDTCEITTVEIGVTPEDYNVIQLLGRGSFGEVFLVQNRVT